MKNIEMTSKEIADITGKNHKNVLQDIRGKLLPKSVEFNANSNGLKFELVRTSYIDVVKSLHSVDDMFASTFLLGE